MSTRVSFFIALFVLFSTSFHLEAATFTVTKTVDTADGSCDADCSLREAVVAANGAPGADIVEIPAGDYLFTLDGDGEDASATGDLDITDDAELRGAGRDLTIIDGNLFDNVVEVHGVTAVIADLTLRQSYDAGLVNRSGNVTLADTTITAVREIGVYNLGTMAMDGVHIVDNGLAPDNYALGIQNGDPGFEAMLTVTGSRIAGGREGRSGDDQAVHAGG